MSDLYGDTPLHDACFWGKIEDVKMLLKNNENPEEDPEEDPEENPLYEQNREGDTPLHIACTRGNLDIVKLLLNKGANFNIQNNDGNTPYDIASSEIREFFESLNVKVNSIKFIHKRLDKLEEILNKILNHLNLN